MKLILSLDDNVVKNLQGYAKTHDQRIEEVLESLFNQFIQKPSEKVEEIGLDELDNFRELLMHYLNEAIYDLESLAVSNEGVEDDERMAKVFRKLNRDHISNAHLLTDLYSVYKAPHN